MKKKRLLKNLLRTCITVFSIALIMAIAYFALRSALPDVIHLLETGREDDIVEYIRGMGSINGVLMLALIQALQVASIFLPGVPVWIAAGILFPVYVAFPVCHLSYLAVNCAVFYLNRRYKGKFSKLLFTEEEESGRWGLIKNARSPAYMTMLACLIPLVPNGIIPYLSANSKISFKSYFWAIYIGSFPQFFVFTSVGGRILRGDFLLAAVLVAFMLALVTWLYIRRNKVLDLIEEIDKRRKAFISRRGDGTPPDHPEI